MLLIASSLMLMACNNKQSEDIPVSTISQNQIEVMAENLEIPWSIQKLGNTFYLSERVGSIVKVEGDRQERQQVELKKELATAAEAGLLGFVLDPNFQQTNLAYAYYTYENSSGQYNRIVTLQLENNVWREEQLLFDNIPSGPFHHGGRLRIGPDNKLYATTGDALESALAQDLNSLGGKILRMNLDGSIPNDNPFPNSYIYSYGHRNPQGLTWLADGSLYASEHGNDANDEINKIEAGKNYGWRIIQGNEKREGLETPIFTSGSNATWAPSGMDHYNGKLYVAALRGAGVYEFNLANKESEKVISGLGRIRDVFIDEEFLYFISNNKDGRGNPQENDDKLYRVSISQFQ